MLLITYALSVISGDAGDASSDCFSGEAGGVRSLFIGLRNCYGARTSGRSPWGGETHRAFIGLRFTSVLHR